MLERGDLKLDDLFRGYLRSRRKISEWGCAGNKRRGYRNQEKCSEKSHL